MVMHMELIKRTHTELLSGLSVEDQLQVARDCNETAHALVWEEQDYDGAIQVLNRALQIYQRIHGKHHRSVGTTCDYIGTAYWLEQDYKSALKYFLEARRIYCKSGQGKIQSVDGRIRCILQEGLQLQKDDIEEYFVIIKETIHYELQGDRLKQIGFHDEAKKEYGKARRHSLTLQSFLLFGAS